MIVVKPGNDIPATIQPSKLTGFKKENRESPYIAGILKQHQNSFTVGNRDTFKNPFSERRRRSIEDTEFTNVALEKGKDYSIAVIGHENEVRRDFLSSLFLTH